MRGYLERERCPLLVGKQAFEYLLPADCPLIARGLPVVCPWFARGLPVGKQVFERLRRLDERPLRRDERLICPLVAL